MNQRTQIFHLAIAILGCFPFLAAYSQNRVDYNLGFHYVEQEDFKWMVTLKSAMGIDSSEIVHGKYPLCIESKKGDLLDMGVAFICHQLFFVPPAVSPVDSVSVSIRNQCYYLREAQLRLFCLDEEDNVTYIDSMNINNDSCWIKKSLTFQLAEAKKIMVGMKVRGYPQGYPQYNKQQKFKLDRVDISFNDQSIENFNYTPAIPVQRINREAITPLDIEDVNSLNNIQMPDNKTIIGLGESLHGSRTFNRVEMLMLKNLIQNHNCKLILFEYDISQTLLWNLFILGKTPTDAIETIKEYLSETLISSDELGEFLIWLRQYNETAQEKIKIYGLENTSLNVYRPWFEYFFYLLNENNASTLYPLLELIDKSKTFQVVEMVRQSAELKEIMGQEDYAAFLYPYEGNRLNGALADSVWKADDFFPDRNYTMSLSADRFISSYGKENARIAIVAHLGHLQKKAHSTSFPYIYPLGYYLSKQYKEKYHVIGLFAGAGSISPLACKWESDVIKLEKPVIGSIEDACLTANHTCFFYPADSLNNTNLYYRWGGNRYLQHNPYLYSYLKKQIDGLIFIENIQANNTSNVDTWQLMIDRLLKNSKKQRDIFNSLKK